eukprot:4638281-Prymnesium_polylepis.2
MEGQRWQGACDGLNTLRVLNVRDSTSKAHNLNAALAEVSTDHVVIYDADHHPDPPSLEILTSYMLAHRCACVQGSTYLRRQDSALALLINAEFFITHFVIFPAQQVFINTGFFGGSNALWSAAVLKQRHFRHGAVARAPRRPLPTPAPCRAAVSPPAARLAARRRADGGHR